LIFKLLHFVKMSVPSLILDNLSAIKPVLIRKLFLI